MNMKRITVFMFVFVVLLTSVFPAVNRLSVRSVSGDSIDVSFTPYARMSINDLLTKKILEVRIDYSGNTWIKLGFGIKITYSSDSEWIGTELNAQTDAVPLHEILNAASGSLVIGNTLEIENLGDTDYVKSKFPFGEYLSTDADLEALFQKLFGMSLSDLENIGDDPMAAVQMLFDKIPDDLVIELSLSAEETDADGNSAGNFSDSESVVLKKFSIDDKNFGFAEIPSSDSFTGNEISWQLPKIPNYGKKTKTILKIKDQKGNTVYENNYELLAPADINFGYAESDKYSISDGKISVSPDISFRMGQTYTFIIDYVDWNGQRIVNNEKSTSVAFSKYYAVPSAPEGEINTLMPSFAWSFDYEGTYDDFGYYFVKAGDKNFRVNDTSFETPQPLEWNKNYEFSVVPYYSDGTPFYPESEAPKINFFISAPVISWSIPQENMLAGRSYDFSAGITNFDDYENVIKSVVWSFNGKPVNGNEITFKPAERISGGALKVSFFDIWGKEYSLNSELNVYKPDISILNPVNNTKIPYGEKIIFSGIISDMDSYAWLVNGETVAENISQKEYEFNSVGDFEIKLIGNFMDESFEKAVNVKVEPPIQKTDADLSVLLGDTVNLNLRVSQGIRVSDITWYYDGEEIGKGISVSYVFSGLGEKEIKAVYVDYEVIYTVNVANVSVISPRDGEYYLPGNIKLISEANTDNVQWFVNGEFAGTGKQISYDFTDYGEYLIQVGSTESKGINIYIYKPVENALIEGAENNGQYYNDSVLELSVIAETEIGIKSVLWYADDSPVYTGNNFKPDLKFMGASRNHKIKAEVTDIKGNMTFAEIIIFVMEKPEFRIISPSDKSTFSVGEEFVISGNFISGSFDSVESLVWYYDGDAVSENTLSAVVKAESEGEKEIKAVLKDKLGNEFTKEITVKITNNSYIRITSPVQNQKFVFGENINAQAEGFRNTAAGKQSLNMEGLSWKLNSEDAGFGRLIVLKNLNPGEYSLTAVHPEVQDSVSVDFTITKPDIVIGLNDGFIYNAGTKLKLSAKIPAGVILKWYIDGNETASGNNTEIIPDVNEGQHVLTARGQLGTTELESSISFSVNRLPVIVLNSPLDGKEYGKGEEIYILPEVTDPEGKNVKVTYTLDSKSYSGDRIMTSMLIPGVHRFGVYAQDENGGKSQIKITFTVIDGPKVYINSPKEGSNFMVNESIPISFTSEGRNVSLQWYLDGSEIYDESIYFERAGNHKLKVIATDEFDNIATSEVNFSVLNSGVLRILSPKDGSVINSGDNILLRAEAFGIQNAETVTWLIDGVNAGEGAELAVSSEGLESGAHIINALISDLNQKVTFGINTKPEITVNRSDIVYLRGSSYEIKANVSDKEKNVKNENIKWNIDGKEVYRGEYFNLITVNPEAGEHILTVSVTDDMGMYSEITVNIKVIEKMGVSFKGISEKQIITKKMSAESSVSGGLPPYTFKWQIIQTGKNPFEYTDMNLDIIPSENNITGGVSVVKLFVTDSLGNTGSYEAKVDFADSISVFLTNISDGMSFVTGQNIKPEIKIFNPYDSQPDVKWYINGQEVSSDLSPVIETSSYEIGVYTLSVSVSVGNDLSQAKAEIIFTDNFNVKINSVQEFYDKGNIEISGEAFSPEGNDISDEILWYSDLQGEIGKGAVINPDLRAGKHIIIAKISGAESTVSITVLGEAALSIESPLNDSVYYGETEFKASATDKDQTVSDEIMWISNLEGEIGKGSEFTQELKEGKHTITAVFKSKFGETYTKTVDIDVAAENSEVSLEIPQEFNGQIVFAGTPVNLYVYLTGTDEKTEWYSDLEGLIGEGSNVEIIFTKTGEHKITVKAGNVSASVTIKVAEFKEEKMPFGVVTEVSGRVYSDSEITVGTVVFYDEIINIEKNSYVKILKTDATYYEKRNNSGNTVQDVLGEVKK